MGQKLVLVCKRIKDDIKANGAGLAAVAACFVLFAFFFGEVCPPRFCLDFPVRAVALQGRECISCLDFMNRHGRCIPLFTGGCL